MAAKVVIAANQFSMSKESILIMENFRFFDP